MVEPQFLSQTESKCSDKKNNRVQRNSAFSVFTKDLKTLPSQGVTQCRFFMAADFVRKRFFPIVTVAHHRMGCYSRRPAFTLVEQQKTKAGQKRSCTFAWTLVSLRRKMCRKSAEHAGFFKKTNCAIFQAVERETFRAQQKPSDEEQLANVEHFKVCC